VVERLPVLSIDRPLQVLPGLRPEADAAAKRLYDDAVPGVVQITTDSSTASGFFVDDTGRVITNAHVVQDKTEVLVLTPDGHSYRARIEKLDDINDLAVLKLDGLKPNSYKHLPLGSSANLRADLPVYALGHPQGVRPTFISPGYFRSAGSEYDFQTRQNNNIAADLVKKKSELTPKETADLDAYLGRPLLHGRVHLQGGNSGGPLLDEQGKVVGVADWVERRDNSNAYFVPAEKVTELINGNEDKFAFSYGHSAEPWADLYKWQWHSMPTVAAVETGIAGMSGLGLARLAAARPGFGAFGAVTLGVVGASALVSDGEQFLASTNSRDRWKYGVAAASDLAMVGGAAARFVPAARPYSLIASGFGLLGRIGADFIPNRLVLTDIRRKNGEQRAPFDPDKI
jgi:hypothetical protein